MSEHITEWLGAYFDGELHGPHLRLVENHLSGCAKCQMELDELRGLSALLRETKPEGDFLPRERFIANLTLNLPRQNGTTQTRKVAELGWWLIPAAIIGAWVFIQLTTQLSALIMTAANVGLFEENLSWLWGSNTRQMAWFGWMLNIFGSPAASLAILNDMDVFIRGIASQMLWQAALGIIYLAWLTGWWLQHQRQTKIARNFSLS